MLETIPDRVIARVRTKVVMGPGGCHISTYSVASHGYAQIGWHEGGERIVTLAHRVVWIAQYGPIEEGMTVDHLCKNRRCVRLLHLRVIPNLENARRTSGRDWPLGQCVNGHPDEGNWVPSGAGRIKGYCRKCMTDSRARWELANPGKAREAKIRYELANPEKVRESKRRYAEKRRRNKSA